VTITATEDRLRLLELHVADLSADLRVLRGLIAQDHASALNKIRYVTEKVLHGLCAKHQVSWGTKEPTLENMIGPLIAAKVIPKNIAVHVRTIQTNASPGSHFQEDALSATHVQVAQIALLELLEWSYGDDTRAAASALPRADVRGRPRWPIAVGGALLLAVCAAGAFVALRREPGTPAHVATADAAAVIREPTAGLAAIARFENPTGEDIDLGTHGLWQTAAADLERAAAEPGASVRIRAAAHFARGKYNLVRGNHELALEEACAAIASDPSWAAPHVVIASAYADQGAIDSAIIELAEAQRLEPDRWAWIAATANVHAAADQLDDAISEYQRALRLAPEEPALHAAIALVYHASGLDRPAHDHAAKAIAAAPAMVAPHLIEAELALEARDGPRARDEASLALALAPHSVPAMLDLADALVLLGEDAEALARYAIAVEEARARAGGGATEERVAEAERAVAAADVKAVRDRLRPTPKPSKKKRSSRSRKKMNLAHECIDNPLAC
jgi:tetratricopeptide (TPR) repeat protein